MHGDRKLFELFDYLIEKTRGVDQMEILLNGGVHSLTRFFNNHIHQNVSSVKSPVSIRVIKNGKIGAAQTDRIDFESLREIVEKAKEIARSQPKDPEFKSLPVEKRTVSKAYMIAATAEMTPAERAVIVKEIIDRTREKGAKAAGSVSNSIGELCVVNSLGIHSYQASTSCEFNLVVTKGVQSGYAYWADKDVRNVNVSDLTRAALEKVGWKSRARKLPPGKYTVVLEPHAVGTLINDLSYTGFGAKAYQEQRSFMNEAMGKSVAAPSVTIWDDGKTPNGIPLLFDFEGVRKKKVTLIKNGVACGVVHDSRTAAKDPKAKNTGHALPAPNTYGPFALNLHMEPGPKTVKQMIRSVKRGIYVTRFWYSNIVNPLLTIGTGMTRDGTFLIENGERVYPIKNMRFTQNILEALRNVKALSKQTRLVEGYGEPSSVPAAVIDNFTFTGVSEM